MPRYTEHTCMGLTNKSMQHQSAGRGLVRLNNWGPLRCLSFCQHGSKVKNGSRATGVGWDYDGSVDVRDLGMNACLSSSRSLQPSPALNVKCLTGRLSEEELQRGVAALQPGGGNLRVLLLCQAAYFTTGSLGYSLLHQVYWFPKR